MAWLLPFGMLAVAACFGVLLGGLIWRRRRLRKAEAMARLSIPLPRVRLRSQVIVLAPESLEGSERDYETASVHSAPTREFAAYAAELAAQSMHPASPFESAVHEAPTREFAAHMEEQLVRQPATLPPPSRAESGRARAPSGFELRTRLASEHRERRDDDATLKVSPRESQAPGNTTAEQLLRMLGPSPTPDLGNIEIYYRLGLAFLAGGKPVQARRCFLTVEEISPGYRDAALHLAEIPIYAPTVSGATPVHHLSERAQRRK